MKDKKPKKKLRRNPAIPPIKARPKKLPKRRSKEMSVRTAKRIWFAPRKKGRPSKEASERLDEAKKILLKAKEPLKRAIVRKNVQRGRPRKNPKIDNKPKRPRGRPRKHPKVVGPKRPRGRPRKHPKVDKPKRPRGRPRKHPKIDADTPKRPRGRPRKNPDEVKKIKNKTKEEAKKKKPKKKD